jgi:hypothetical protein
MNRSYIEYIFQVVYILSFGSVQKNIRVGRICNTCSNILQTLSFIRFEVITAVICVTLVLLECDTVSLQGQRSSSPKTFRPHLKGSNPIFKIEENYSLQLNPKNGDSAFRKCVGICTQNQTLSQPRRHKT